jgi:mono/diheme cytochrome c family protein
MKELVVVLLVVVTLGACNSSGSSGGDEYSDVVKIYNTNCGICHGKNGRKGLAGAKILPESELTVEERIEIITNGKGQMMPYKNLLSEEEIKAVAEYTMTFE